MHGIHAVAEGAELANLAAFRLRMERHLHMRPVGVRVFMLCYTLGPSKYWPHGIVGDEEINTHHQLYSEFGMSM